MKHSTAKHKLDTWPQPSGWRGHCPCGWEGRGYDRAEVTSLFLAHVDHDHRSAA